MPKIEVDIDAKRLWDKIIHNAWQSAEPGVLFWDTIIRESVPDCYADKGYRTVSTNPCGEIPLCPYDSCRLLAINLYSYVQNPFTKGAFLRLPPSSKNISPLPSASWTTSSTSNSKKSTPSSIKSNPTPKATKSKASKSASGKKSNKKPRKDAAPA